MLFSQLARLCKKFLSQHLRPGLVKWGSQIYIWLRSAKFSCLLFIFSLFLASGATAQAPSLEVNTNTSTDGYYVLSWNTEAGQSPQFLLQESSDQSFSNPQLIYSGADKSRVISGKANGDYYYRIALADSSSVFSSPVAVEVRHHSLQRAFSFFFLGLVVFGSILVTVFTGMRSQDGVGS